MSSVLDTLTPEQYAEVLETVEYRRLERALLGRGLWPLVRQRIIRDIAVANPGAGNEWSVTPPSGAAWEVLYLVYQLSTSATVITRNSVFLVQNQDAQLRARYQPQGSQAASLSVAYTYVEGIGVNGAVSGQIQALPPGGLYVPPAWSIQTSTPNIQAGDAYSGIAFTVREWSISRVVNACRDLLADLDSAGGIRYSER